MRNCKPFALIIVVVGCVIFPDGHSSFAQWQPVIRMDACPTYQPVCARSRKRVLVTYANACAARSDRARVVSDGVCPDNCPPLYKPVCGRDANGQRRSYVNSCAAENAKAHFIRRGSCWLPSRQP